MKPIISVIIPNYNHSKFLKERIESVLNQTYQNFEVIILDDCSKDNSKEIIEEYRSDKRITQIIYNEKNSGSTFKQWKKGIELARGEYIWIAESDDVADILFIEKLLAKLRDKEADIIFCNSLIIDDKSNLIKNDNISNVPCKELFLDFETNFIMDSKEFIMKWLFGDNFVPNASAVIFKKDKVNFKWWIKLEKMRLLGDWLFWIYYLFESKKIIYSSESLNYFRTHSTNVRIITNDTFELIIEFSTVFEELIKNKIGNKKKYLDRVLFKLNQYNKAGKLKNIRKIVVYRLLRKYTKVPCYYMIKNKII